MTATPPPAETLLFPARGGMARPYAYQAAGTAPRRGAVLLLDNGAGLPPLPPLLPQPGELALPGFDLFAWTPADADSFEARLHGLQDDVDHLARAHGWAPGDMHLLAAGDAALLATAWLHDHAPRLRGLTLVAPVLAPRRPVAPAPAGQAEAADRVVRDAAAITLPVQLLLSTADTTAAPATLQAFFSRLGSSMKTRQELPGLFADAPDARVRTLALETLCGFVQRLADHPPAPADLRQADRHGPGVDEARTLAAPLATWSPRGLRWALVRACLRLAGQLSPGLGLALSTGLDSGRTVDYLYRNIPHPLPLLGPRVDAAWLGSAWGRALRQRKQHVAELVHHAMRQVAARPRPVLVLDIAGGRGRSLFDALAESAAQPAYVLLRDHAAGNVRAARMQAEQRGLGHRVRCEQADGLDPATLGDFAIRATIAIAAGLYERCPDNTTVQQALAGLARAVEPGGYLVYSNQPWHPDAEWLARAMDRPLRLRSQAEMDQLVAEAGFRKLAQRTGPGGVHTVSLAQRDDGAP